MGGIPTPGGGETREVAPPPESAKAGPLLLDLVQSLAAPAGFANPNLVDHNTLVARIGGEIAQVLGQPGKDREALVLAGLLHDIGIVGSGLPLAHIHSQSQLRDDGHAAVGAKLIESIAPLAHVAPIVRHHHNAWNHGQGRENGAAEAPIAAHLLNLCDTVAVLADPRWPTSAEREDLCSAIRQQSGTQLHPDHVEAFLELAQRPEFWEDSLRRPAESLHLFAADSRLTLDSASGLQLARTFSQLADLHAGSAPTHGVSVGTIAALLGRAAGWTPARCDLLCVAGYVHDIGQMAVPVSVLTRPERLSEGDWTILRAHAHLGSRVLRQLPGYDELSVWVAHHHERMNGVGYPERLRGNELPLGSRILQVADAYSAMSEDRPYRAGRTASAALREMQVLTRIGLFDPEVVGWLAQLQDPIEDAREKAQNAAALRLARLHQLDARRAVITGVG